MKAFIFIFFYIIEISISILPIWNLKNSSKDLIGTGNSHEYTIANRHMYELTITLKKKILKSDGKITHQNTLDITGKSNIKVDFEDIESFYGQSVNGATRKNIYVLCPRGNFNPINPFNNQYLIYKILIHCLK